MARTASEVEAANEAERIRARARERIEEFDRLLPHVAAGAAQHPAGWDPADRADWCVRMADELARAAVRHRLKVLQRAEEDADL
jgi:hypothetical protein